MYPYIYNTYMEILTTNLWSRISLYHHCHHRHHCHCRRRRCHHHHHHTQVHSIKKKKCLKILKILRKHGIQPSSRTIIIITIIIILQKLKQEKLHGSCVNSLWVRNQRLRCGGVVVSLFSSKWTGALNVLLGVIIESQLNGKNTGFKFSHRASSF